jgi:MFS family permease
MSVVYVTKFYADDSHEVELALKITGIPLSFVPDKRLFLLTWGLVFLIASLPRIFVLVLEQKHQLEGLKITFNVRHSEEKGGLNLQYYSKGCFLVEFLCNYVLKAYKVVEILVPFMVFSLSTLYSFLTPGLTFSYTMIIGCFYWTLIVWLTGSIIFCGFVAYFGSITFVMYRFKQVNERIKYCGSNIKMLVSAIHEHHEICR